VVFGEDYVNRWFVDHCTDVWNIVIFVVLYLGNMSMIIIGMFVLVFIIWRLSGWLCELVVFIVGVVC